MNRFWTDRILPFVTLTAFELSALIVAIQVFVFVRSGDWMTISLGSVLQRIGFPPPPADWMGGSVYDLAWNEPLALITLVIGLLAATYAAIGRYETESDEPAYVYP